MIDYNNISNTWKILSVLIGLIGVCFIVYKTLRQIAKTEYAELTKYLTTMYFTENELITDTFPLKKNQKFLLVELNKKEIFLLIGDYSYKYHLDILEKFKKKIYELSKFPKILGEPKIDIHGGGKIIPSKDYNLIIFYDKSEKFGDYDKNMLEEFQEQLKKTFGVQEIQFNKGYLTKESWS